MMKENILEEFKDLNFMYNDCTRLDLLNALLNDYEMEIYTSIIKVITDRIDNPLYLSSIIGDAIRENDNYKYIEIY